MLLGILLMAAAAAAALLLPPLLFPLPPWPWVSVWYMTSTTAPLPPDPGRRLEGLRRGGAFASPSAARGCGRCCCWRWRWCRCCCCCSCCCCVPPKPVLVASMVLAVPRLVLAVPRLVLAVPRPLDTRCFIWSCICCALAAAVEVAAVAAAAAGGGRRQRQLLLLLLLRLLLHPPLLLLLHLLLLLRRHPAEGIGGSGDLLGRGPGLPPLRDGRLVAHGDRRPNPNPCSATTGTTSGFLAPGGLRIRIPAARKAAGGWGDLGGSGAGAAVSAAAGGMGREVVGTRDPSTASCDASAAGLRRPPCPALPCPAFGVTFRAHPHNQRARSTLVPDISVLMYSTSSYAYFELVVLRS